MKFNLNDFMQLDTKALLAVNGGTSCSTSSDSLCSYSYSRAWGSSSGGHGSSGCGSSGGGGCSGSSYSGNSSTSESGGGSCGGTSPSLQNPSDEVRSGGGNCGGNTHSSHGVQVPDYPGFDRCPATTATEKIMQEIAGKGDFTLDTTGERKGCYNTGSYQCDEYVEEMIKGAGYNPKDYYVDNPSGKKVDEHIAELKNSNKDYKTDSTKLTEGAYVVFMSDKDKIVNSHSGLLFVNSDGSAYMYDNSSRNFKNKDGTYSGGIERTSGESASTVCGKYPDYENFYFQKLK